MLINKVKLNNYRNYQGIEINLKPNLNIIIGKNGVGKTNILESLIVISNTKSFRTLNDIDLIKKDCDYSKIECETNDNNLKIVISKNGKTLFINNNPIKKTSEFIGRTNCILFKPSDLDIFNHSPKERRRLLDIEIGKISKTYLNATLTYNSLLKDKNKLLKENNIDNDYLNLINEQMIPQMELIIKEREEFIKGINTKISDYYKEISGINSNIKIIYDKCSEIELLKEMIDKSFEKDLYYHYAVNGTHHEDYHFLMDEYPLESIASQGQTRMVLISFKLALVEYIKNKTGKIPILLLDDILSELDIDNRTRLLNMIPKDCQVVLTGTEITGIKINDECNVIKLGG